MKQRVVRERPQREESQGGRKMDKDRDLRITFKKPHYYGFEGKPKDLYLFY